MAKTSKPPRGDGGDDTVRIKKYANRRLYDTERSRYITLDDLAAMIRAGREFVVVDAKTDEDITHAVLTQIIMEEEARGQTMLPVNFLRQLIGLYGNSMQSFVPGYLDASIDSFRANQTRVREAFGDALTRNPLVELSRRNMEMFQAMTGIAMPADDQTDTKDAEIAALKAELAALRAKGRKRA